MTFPVFAASVSAERSRSFSLPTGHHSSPAVSPLGNFENFRLKSALRMGHGRSEIYLFIIFRLEMVYSDLF